MPEPMIPDLKHPPLRRCAHALLVMGCAAIVVPDCAAHAQAHDGAALPLSLRQVLDSVRVNHPMVRAAESRVRAAQGERTTARAFANPVLSYQVDQTPFPGGRPLP